MIDEAVLHRVVGSRAILREQLVVSSNSLWICPMSPCRSCRSRWVSARDLTDPSRSSVSCPRSSLGMIDERIRTLS
uniref:hypothetical protein n=1 Tax=Actinoplanes awajinensis TaxID=135946 RepID=UPI00373FD1A4